MRWPWQHDERATQPLVRDVTGAAEQVAASAVRVLELTAELDAAAELVRRNEIMLARGAGDRRLRRDPAYAGPERRRAR